MTKQVQETQGEPDTGETTAAAAKGRSAAKSRDDGPGSETERFRALVDVTHNESVTGESGVPAKQRDHEQRCQRELLDEFS